MARRKKPEVRCCIVCGVALQPRKRKYCAEHLYQNRLLIYRAYVAKDREKHREGAKRWRLENPEKYRALRKRQNAAGSQRRLENRRAPLKKWKTAILKKLQPGEQEQHRAKMGR